MQESSKEGHLDEVLNKLGAFGRSQVLTLLMMSLVYATNSMYNINYVFAVEDVQYRCRIPCESNSTTFEVAWLNHSSIDILQEDSIKQCSVYKSAGSCGRFDSTQVERCTEWVYQNPHSFVAEFDLACQEWKATLVGTIHSVGNMLGLLIQGHISDRWGRKTAAVFAGSVGAVLGICKSFAQGYWVYLTIEGIEAAVGDALSPMFMLSVELVEKKRAVLFQMILLNCYTLGLILMAYMAWLVPYWRHFLRVIYAPTLLILTYSVFLDESIRWLYSKGKRDEAEKLIKKIAKRNNVVIDQKILSKVDYVQEIGGFNDKALLWKTFKSKIMMKRFLVCLVWWFTITLINYGMMVSAVLIDGNKYINFALLMTMDIPSNIFFWLALSKYKRKLPLLVSFIVGGIFCISHPFLPKERQIYFRKKEKIERKSAAAANYIFWLCLGYAWLGLMLFMGFEFLATFSYNIVYMYTSELFPTYTRNSMHALCSAVGRVGSLIAPQTPLLMHYWSGLPSLIFGLTSLLSGCLTLLMPETANTELPNTVELAEEIGKRAKPRHDNSEGNGAIPLMQDKFEDQLH